MKNICIHLIYCLILVLMVIGCGLPVNHLALEQRSMAIPESSNVRSILAKARLIKSNDPKVNHIKVLILTGTPYEMGFQHGRLLKDEINTVIYNVMTFANILAEEDMMDEIYDIMDPYISLEEKEEMRGLAHGANLPLRLVHWFHCIPEVSEYGQNDKFVRPFFKNFFGATSCSNIVAYNRATRDGALYQMRILDWLKDYLDLQSHPLILVHRPNQGYASVTFGYVGYIGCVSGMNANHMAFGEKGQGNPEAETLAGKPFPFLFRELMRKTKNLDEVTAILKNTPRTCSYAYMVSDAKNNTVLSYVTNSREVIVEKTAQGIGKEPFMEDVAYRGYHDERIYPLLNGQLGRIDQNVFMALAKKIGMKNDNMQNVIFKPETLETWVTNAGTASGEAGQAYNQKWFYYNFYDALKKTGVQQ